jgi:hypothetical protein
MFELTTNGNRIVYEILSVNSNWSTQCLLFYQSF